MDKFIQFLKLCKFGDFSDVKKWTLTIEGLKFPTPDDLIIEAFKRGDFPLMWDDKKLKKHLKLKRNSKNFYLDIIKKPTMNS